MTQLQLTKTIFVASMVFVFAGSAQAEIVECIDEAGVTTFTDVPCPTEADAARGAAQFATPLASTKTAVRNINFPDVKGADASPKQPVAHQQMELDVATLRAARIAMVAMDHEADYGNQHALARVQSYQ